MKTLQAVPSVCTVFCVRSTKPEDLCDSEVLSSIGDETLSWGRTLPLKPTADITGSPNQ